MKQIKPAVGISADVCPSTPLSVRIVGVLMVLSAFLLPLKWGTLAAMTEAAGFFPENFVDYLHITWPAHSFGIWSGILLVAVLLLPGITFSLCSAGICMLLWSAGLLIAGLPGAFAAGADAEFALAEIANCAGVAAWTMAVWHFSRIAPKWARYMATAFFVGMIITALNGFYQYFFGFAEMRAFVDQQISEGIVVPDAIIKKLADTRISSFMASCNALSGGLLMILPLLFYFSNRWGGCFEPARMSRRLFAAIGLLVIGGALVLCRSRSTLLVLMIAIAVAVFSAPVVKMRYKVIIGFAGILFLTACAGFAWKYGRGFASILERADYLRTSAVLTWENPFSGAGWGGFFYRHMVLKFSNVVEAARDPHNIVAAFAGQSGVVSGLIVLAMLLLPLKLLWKSRFKGDWQCVVFWCGVLFTLHALMDCDMHIPALMGGMSMLYATALEFRLPGKKIAAKMVSLLIGAVVAMSAMTLNWRVLRGEYMLAEFTEFINPSTSENRLRFALMPMEEIETRLVLYRPYSALVPELAGDWLLSRGDLVQAEERYRKSLAINPRRPGIYRRLSWLCCHKGDFAAGREFLQQAQQRFPGNNKYSPDYPVNRAMLNGDFAAAAEARRSGM